VPVPERIVSLVPSVTELLFDLGAGSRVVGITRFCTRPAERVAGTQVVGGTRGLDLDVIAGLRPDLILAGREENDRDEILGLAGTYPVWVSDVRCLDDALAMIRSVGDLAACTEAARGMADRIAAGFDRLAPMSPPKRAAYLVWRRPLLVAGRGTLIGDLLARCGLQNPVGDGTVSRYPEVALEDLAAVDVLLLSSEPYPFGPEDRAELRRRLPEMSVHLVDGEMFSWYGSRLLHSPGYLAGLITRLRE